MAVAVFPAVLNTVEDNGETPLERGVDGSVDNPADRLHEEVFNTIAADFRNYGQAFVPPEYRRLASSWGYDPAYNETALPPLSLTHFTGRKPEIAVQFLEGIEPYECPEESALAASADDESASESQVSASPSTPRSRLWLALHEVHYDAAKERWYADVRVSLRDKFRQLTTNPFVRLAVATYQKAGRPGYAASEIVQCDPCKLLGDRTLEVVRESARRFTLKLRGAFDHIAEDGFPARRVLARVQARPGGLPAELEVQQIPENQSRLALSPGPIRRQLRPAVTIAEVELNKLAENEFAAVLTWEPGADNDHNRLILELSETEYFPTSDQAAASAGEIGVEYAMIRNRLCGAWTRYYLALEIR